MGPTRFDPPLGLTHSGRRLTCSRCERSPSSICTPAKPEPLIAVSEARAIGRDPSRAPCALALSRSGAPPAASTSANTDPRSATSFFSGRRALLVPGRRSINTMVQWHDSRSSCQALWDPSFSHRRSEETAHVAVGACGDLHIGDATVRRPNSPIRPTLTVGLIDGRCRHLFDCPYAVNGEPLFGSQVALTHGVGVSSRPKSSPLRPSEASLREQAKHTRPPHAHASAAVLLKELQATWHVGAHADGHPWIDLSTSARDLAGTVNHVVDVVLFAHAFDADSEQAATISTAMRSAAVQRLAAIAGSSTTAAAPAAGCSLHQEDALAGAFLSRLEHDDAVSAAQAFMAAEDRRCRFTARTAMTTRRHHPRRQSAADCRGRSPRCGSPQPTSVLTAAAARGLKPCRRAVSDTGPPRSASLRGGCVTGPARQRLCGFRDGWRRLHGHARRGPRRRKRNVRAAAKRAAMLLPGTRYPNQRPCDRAMTEVVHLTGFTPTPTGAGRRVAQRGPAARRRGVQPVQCRLLHPDARQPDRAGAPVRSSQQLRGPT